MLCRCWWSPVRRGAGDAAGAAARAHRRRSAFGRRRVGEGAGARDRERGPGADRVRVGADRPPVGRVQGGPPAGDGERGGDARQRVAGRDRVPGGRRPAGQGQDRAGADEARVGADRPGRWPRTRRASRRGCRARTRCPTACRRAARRSARAWRDRARYGGRGCGGPYWGRSAWPEWWSPVVRVAEWWLWYAAGVAGTARDAGVRLGRAEGPRGSGRRHDEQDAPGERHARGPSPHAHGAALSFQGCKR